MPIGDELMSQTEARQLAAKLMEKDLIPDGLIAIAVPYPYNSWGGSEQGWTVAYVVTDRSTYDHVG